MSVQGIGMTLSTGKKVVLRKLTVGLRNDAVEAASLTSNTEAVLNLRTQSEMLKILLVKIDGKEQERSKLESKEYYEGLFTMQETNELMLVLQEMAGTENVKKPKLEIVTL